MSGCQLSCTSQPGKEGTGSLSWPLTGSCSSQRCTAGMHPGCSVPPRTNMSQACTSGMRNLPPTQLLCCMSLQGIPCMCWTHSHPGRSQVDTDHTSPHPHTPQTCRSCMDSTVCFLWQSYTLLPQSSEQSTQARGHIAPPLPWLQTNRVEGHSHGPHNTRTSCGCPGLRVHGPLHCQFSGSVNMLQ